LYRLTIVALLTVIYSVVGLIYPSYRTGNDFSHLAYIPIVLSGIWWNRKAVIVAAILALITTSFHWLKVPSYHPLDLLLIPGSFIFIALFIGTLNEKLKTKHRTLIETENNYLLRHREVERERKLLSEAAKSKEDQLVHTTRLAEMGEMAAAIAHELNQPLTGIKNFAKNALYIMQQTGGCTEDVRDNLTHISHQVDRAARIINQMRELARISETQFIPLQINDILKESLDFLKPHLKNSGIETFFGTADNLPLIKGDKIRLEQVFLNILTNARQSMENSEERRLLIQTHLEESLPPQVVVDILDTGRGFRQEDADKLFTPFYTTKNPGQGTGLGLSISLSIIHDHKGSIEATGAVGEGALFKVKLPVFNE